MADTERMPSIETRSSAVKNHNFMVVPNVNLQHRLKKMINIFMFLQYIYTAKNSISYCGINLNARQLLFINSNSENK